MTDINYLKLNDRIVEQATDGVILSKEQRERLFKDKIARAEAELKSREVFARGSKYSSSR